MFKKLETAWNARTPVYLHNGTKENLIFQFGLLGIVLGIMWMWDRHHEQLMSSPKRKKYPQK